MKNFFEINRALAAKKNFNFMGIIAKGLQNTGGGTSQYYVSQSKGNKVQGLYAPSDERLTTERQAREEQRSCKGSVLVERCTNHAEIAYLSHSSTSTQRRNWTGSASVSGGLETKTATGHKQKKHFSSERMKIWKYAACMVMILCLGVGNMWGGDKYYLFTPSGGGPAHTGSLSGEFICQQSPNASTQTIDGVSFSHCVAVTANTSLSASWTTQFAGTTTIDYDLKTTAATFTVYAYNSSSTNYGVCKAEVEEGGTPTSFSQVGSNFKSSGQKISFNVTTTKNKRVRIGNSSYGNVKFYQIVVEETGTALPQPGQGTDYAIDFAAKRFAVKAKNKVSTIDGIEVVANSEGKYNGTVPKLSNKNNTHTYYIKFTTSSTCHDTLIVTSSGAYSLNTNASAFAASGTSSGTKVVLSPSTTYWIKGQNAEITVSKIEFKHPRAASSDAYDIHIGKNNANYTDESLTNTSGSTWSKTITLDGGSYYEFKVKKTSSGSETWYGNNGSILASIASWTFSTSESNCKLYTTVAGSYTFSWDASNNKLTVTYPAGDHPTKRIYMACGSTWCDATPKFFVHSWGVSDYNTQVQQNACGDYYADIIWYNDYFQFTRNASDATTYDSGSWKNSSQNLTYNSSQTKWTCTGWSDGKGTFTSSAYSPTTYTITFVGNGNTGGSMTNLTGIACGANQAITANAFTKTGYSFAGWKANVNVTVGGATVTAGSVIANSATIQNISQNITLTAQWTAAKYTVTLNNQSATTAGTASVQVTYNASTNLTTSITKPTKTGYTFGGYYTSTEGAGTQLIDENGAWKASVSGFTNASKQWIKAGGVTLYAYWIDDACFKMIANSSASAEYTLASGESITQGSKNCVTLIGGTAVNTGSNEMKVQKPSSYGWYFGSKEDVITITLSGSKLQTGSIISVEGNSGATGNIININGVTVATLSGSAGNFSTSYTVKSTDANLVGAHILEVKRGVGSATRLFSITITNCAARETYNVTYYPNGGSGSSATHNVSEVESMSDLGFSRAGYNFDGWKTGASSGTSYAVGDEVTSVLTLYAQWSCVTPIIGTDLSTTQVDYEQDATATALTVAATANGTGGNGTVGYQWYSNTANSTSSPAPTLLTGQTSATYTPSTTSIGTTYYFCRVTNASSGCATTKDSKIAKIVVSEAPCFKFVSGTKKSGWSNIPIGSQLTTSDYSSGATLTGGTITNSGSATLQANDANGIIFLANQTNTITITLADNAVLDEGTVITINAYATDGSSAPDSYNSPHGFVIGGANTSTVDKPGSSKKEFTISYTVPEGSTLIGKNAFTLTNQTAAKHYVKKITVTGCGSCTSINPTLSYSSASAFQYGKTASPALSGNTGGAAVTYSSSNPDVVFVNSSTGSIKAVGAGSATITATIAATTVGTTDYCGADATCVVTVPALVTQTINTNKAWSTVPNMTVNAPAGSGCTLTRGTNITNNGYTINESDNKSGLSSKFTGSETSVNASKYLSLTFTIDDNHWIEFGEVVVPIQPISNAGNLKITLTDNKGGTAIEPAAVTGIRAGSLTNVRFKISPAQNLKGTITLKIFFYGQTDGFRLGSPILITGMVKSGTLTYDANGGTGAPAAESPLAYGNHTLSSTVPTRTNYRFDGWQVNGAGTVYAAGATFPMPASDVTLKAKWVRQYTMSYNFRAGSGVKGGTLIEPEVYDEGATVTVKVTNATLRVGDTPLSLTVNGKAAYLNGVNSKSDMTGTMYTTAGQTFTITKDTTFYLVWRYNLTYDLQGGAWTSGTTAAPSYVYLNGRSWPGSDKLVPPVGYEFSHWTWAGEGDTHRTKINEGDYGDKTVVANYVPAKLTFTGAANTDWSNTANWSPSFVPTINHEVLIQSPAEVNVTNATAKSVDIAAGGKLTVPAGKALVIAETLTKAGGATAADDVIVNSTRAAGTGALVIGSHEGTNAATVNFESKVRYDNGYVNQYIGSPFSNETPYVDYAIQMYKFVPDGVSGSHGWWDKLSSGAVLEPFIGYNLITNDQSGNYVNQYGKTGTLNAGSTVVKSGTKNGGETETENMYANGWLAPIHIERFIDADFTNINKTIYIFNAGTPEQYDAAGGESAGDADTDGAGTYTVLPVNSVAELKNMGAVTTVIQAMQAFSVMATGSNPSLTLDYNRLVYTPAVDTLNAGKSITIEPTRAPRRSKAADERPDAIRLRIQGENGWATNAYVLGREDFSDGYDDGWDGEYMEGDEAAPQLYTPTADGNMVVNCVPEIEGTTLVFRPGTVDNMFTFSFVYNGSETWYLNDVKEETSTLIDSDNRYAFVSEDGDIAGRFIISRTPYGAPEIATGVGEAQANQAAKARKVLIDNHIYIIRGGRMHDVTGKAVK